ncbi:ATP-grasp fold amidoligase family protein [Eisenbergiella sp.]
MLDEKLMWLKCNEYANNQLVADCADKIKVREYVEKVLETDENLVPIIGAYYSVEDIPWKTLPERFVLKCNHGSHMNIIVKDKKTLDINYAKSQLSKWLHKDFSKVHGEPHYSLIKRGIICEEYIDAWKDSESPIDYKFYCMNGKVTHILLAQVESKILLDRNYNNTNIFIDPDLSFNWRAMKPKKLDEMISIAEKLAQPFPFVRVDLYEHNQHIYVGELTFTPRRNIHDYFSYEGEVELGKLLNI